MLFNKTKVIRLLLTAAGFNFLVLLHFLLLRKIQAGEHFFFFRIKTDFEDSSLGVSMPTEKNKLISYPSPRDKMD